jgi:hypothetical protein
MSMIQEDTSGRGVAVEGLIISLGLKGFVQIVLCLEASAGYIRLSHR